MREFISTDKDFELWALLSLTNDVMLAARQKELNLYNISHRQSAIFFVINAIGDGARPSEISKWLFRQRHTISELLSRMEKEGLVKKFKDLHRKNAVSVTLTEKGRKAYYQTIKRESIHKIISSLSEEERQQLNSCLQKLTHMALKEIGAKHETPFPLLS